MSHRPRLTVLLTAAAVTGAAVLATAVPAGAVTFDGQPVRFTGHFTVAGRPFTVHDASVGDATQVVRIGQHAGRVRSDYRLTVKDDHGRVLATADRGLYRQSVVVDGLSDHRFGTAAAFRRTLHRVLTVGAAAAEAHYLKGLRIQSVSADLETDTGRTIDYLAALPAGAKPDFSAVPAVRSDEYPGTVTVSGSDATHWSVIVRDTRDGYGEFYDATTGGSAVFRF